MRFLFFLWLLAAPIQAKPFDLVLVGVGGSSLADALTTKAARDLGVVEANPILRRSGDAWPAVKGLTTAGSIWALHELHKTRPKLAWGLAVAVTGLYTFAAIHNSRISK